MTTAVMLDIETLGFRPDTVILTFGAIKFDPWDASADPSDGIYFRLDVDEQLSLGRSTDQSTLDWWMEQAEDVREEAMGEGDRTSLEAFTRALNKFLVGVDQVWAQGPTFDMIIIENMYRQLGLPVPWKYSAVRDSRTLFQVHGDPRIEGFEGAHNALVDCYVQAKGVQKVLAEFKALRDAAQE